MLWTQRPKLSLASENLITSHHCLLSCTSSPSVSVLFLRFYCTLHGVTPTFLTVLTGPYVPRRALRSADKLLLEQPTHKLELIGLRAFSCARRASGIPFHLRLKVAHLSLYLNLSWPIFFGKPIFRLLTSSIFRSFDIVDCMVFYIAILVVFSDEITIYLTL